MEDARADCSLSSDQCDDKTDYTTEDAPAYRLGEQLPGEHDYV